MRRTPLFAVSLLFAATLPAQTIHLKTRDLQTIQDLQNYAVGPLKRRSADRSHYLLQFQGGIRPDDIRTLQERGAVVTSYVPDSALMASAGDDLSLAGLDLKWSGRLQPEDKISPLLGDLTWRQALRWTYVVEFHSDVDMAEARELAREHNLWIIERADLLTNHLLVSGAFHDISRLSEWDETAYIFPASPDLLTATPVNICVGALTQNGPLSQYGNMAQGWPAGSGGIELRYVFGSLIPYLPAGAAESEIVRALSEWAKHISVRFTPGSDSRGPRTLNIFFAQGAHGDAYPFDSAGRVLAHTFFPAPPNAEPIAGDAHFNAAGQWRIGSDIDLYTVALHEAGHALGLGHADDPQSIMYPYYRRGRSLSPGDVVAVQQLYGAPSEPPAGGSPPPSPPPASPPPASPPLGGTPSADRTAPSLKITSPGMTMAATSEATITLRGSASDNVGVAQVTWTNSVGFSGTASGTTSWQASVPLRVGTNTITIRAWDAAGNAGWRSVIVVRQ